MIKTVTFLGLLIAGVTQAALLSEINDNAAVANYSEADFSGQTVTNILNNWGYNDNFSGADFSDTILYLNGGNQPFVNATVAGADFSGATINWTPFTLSGDHRINFFRNAAATGVENAGVSFANSVWNITLSEDSIGNTDFFLDGSGALTAATAANALNFAGADFNFSGTDTSLADDIGALLITNLGGFDGTIAIGAFYDAAFLNNNYSDFGYASTTALQTDLDTAGWQDLSDAGVVEQSGDNPIVFDQTATNDNLVVLMAAGAEHNEEMTVYNSTNSYPKHFWIGNFDDTNDWFQWTIYLDTAADYHVDALLSANADEVFNLSVVETGASLDFSKTTSGWTKQDAGVITLPAGTSTLQMVRTSAASNVSIKSLELIRESDRADYLQRIADFKVDTTWFSQAGYGLMFQYGGWGYPQTGDKKSLEDQANDFDVPTFVEMVKGTGASYVIWSITWAEYLLNAPISSVDDYFGDSDQTSSRDLIGEIMEALDAEGIDFMLYYHRGEAETVPWFTDPDFPLVEFTARGTGDRSGFFDSWVTIITEIGNRYGTKLDGWFIDGGLVYYPAPFERLGAAARAGNPNRLVAYNPWVCARYTDFQDVMMGENSQGQIITGSAAPGGDGILTDGPSAGLLQHGMFTMENAWGVSQEDQSITTKSTVISNAQSWVESAMLRNVPISFNMMMWEDGTVSSNSLAVFDALAFGPATNDISTEASITFDSSEDLLTNTNGISAWGSGYLDLNDGSNLSGFDFTALGITSWTAGTFSSSDATTWDGANLSGLNLTFTGHNFGYNDSMVGTDFSDSTITISSYNQAFLYVNAEGADFSGATINLTPYSGRVNFFRKNTSITDTYTSIRDADFSDITWGVAIGDSGSLHDLFFDVGPGTTSAADKDHAVTFEGADLSLITGLSKSNMIANLGGFYGTTPIGAKYDQAMLDASGWTASELDAAGWQEVVESIVVEQSGDNPIVFDQTATNDNLMVLMAAGSEHNEELTVLYPSSYPKHFWINNFDDTADYLQWTVSLETAADYHVDALLSANAGETFSLSVDGTDESIDFEKNSAGWTKQDAGIISLPAGTNTLRLVRTSAAANVNIKSLELIRESDRSDYLQRIEDFKADSAWFSQAGYGLMFQYGAWGYPETGDRKSIEDQANDFDVPAFVEKVKGTGASYIIWSVSWWEYLLNAPISSVDDYFGDGDQTSSRDLIGEIMTALDAEGIDFMLYYHRGQMTTPWFADDEYPKEEFSARGTGDRSVFFDSWVTIITEIGNRYGDKLDGWFFDDGVAYYPAPFERLGAAARAENPNRLVSYNPWIATRITDFQDVMMGEGHKGSAILGSAGEGGDGILTDGPSAGLLQHGMFIMEGDWGVHEEDQAINTSITAAQAISYEENADELNVPISFCMMMWEDGTVSQDSLDIFNTIQFGGAVDIQATPSGGTIPITVAFDGSGTTSANEIVSYAWDFGDGNAAIGILATNTYTVVSNYTATLTVTDVSNHTASASVAISVFDAAISDLSLSVDTVKSGTPPAFSTNDLAQTQYLGSSATGGNQVASEHAQLFNGVIGNEDSGTADAGVVTMDSSNAFTIELNTSVNTNGYDITGIDSIFGWNSASGGRANQGYAIILTFVDESTATLAGPEHWESNSPAFYWTKVSFTESSGGVMASRVKAVTFDITEDANASGVVVGREIDIFGSPTVDSSEHVPEFLPGITVSNGIFNVQFVGSTGQHYRVEMIEDLTSSNAWQVVTDIVSVASSPIEVSASMTNGAAFYQVLWLP
jgi:hypothetical protein